FHVTGVQTCALPIFVVDTSRVRLVVPVSEIHIGRFREGSTVAVAVPAAGARLHGEVVYVPDLPAEGQLSYPVEVILENAGGTLRSEERRVGKGGEAR